MLPQKGRPAMNENQIIALIMTICEQLGQPKNAGGVRIAYNRNLQQLTSDRAYPEVADGDD
jgi:hypothetical protein